MGKVRAKRKQAVSRCPDGLHSPFDRPFRAAERLPLPPCPMYPQLLAIAFAAALALPAAARELTASENALRDLLGDRAPEPILLWPGQPPRFAHDATPEIVTPEARIGSVSVPTISVFLPPPEKSTGMAIIFCAGGGYGGLDWRTHVVYAADVFVPRGIAVVGLKYRTRPPNGRTSADIQAVALLDAQRAVRLVRHRATEWKLDPHKIGIAGYSAGGNLAMNLAANFDAGDPTSPDPIERESCRADYAIGLATWHWRKKESPFTFRRDSPPVFLVHATNDGIDGGAPIEMPRQIEAQLRALGVPVRMEVFDQGGHGVGNLIPQRVKNRFPPATWPERFLRWHESLPASQ